MIPSETPADTRSSAAPSLDQALARYFQQELPCEWRPPIVETTVQGAARSWKSYGALAAAITIVFSAQMFLGRAYQPEDIPTAGVIDPSMEIARPPHKKAKADDPRRGPRTLPQTPPDAANRK
jgi:hypothetical protein